MPRGPREGVRPAFRQWRAGRPFWGGLLLALGGAEVLLTLKASLDVILHVGMQGLAGYLLPVVMLLCGVLILFNPAQRLFYSVIGVLVSLGTWLTSNLGGFFIGLLLWRHAPAPLSAPRPVTFLNGNNAGGSSNRNGKASRRSHAGWIVVNASPRSRHAERNVLS